MPAESAVSLYVHLPFCVRKCRYCDFNSYAWTGQGLRRYVEALLREAQARSEGLRPRTVFFGGGTPSFLPADLLAELLDRLHDATGFRDSAVEVTLEANPESFDPPTAAAARAGGVDRVSLGFQSLRADVLAAYDRVHDREEALAALATARSAGFQRVNVDLIYAFPGQDPRDWESDLRTVLELGPEHLSAYELAYEPGTALTRLRDAGRWTAAEPEVGRRLFESTRDLCAEYGFGQYEVSSYARAGEACLHNLQYWRSLDYEGLGAGAAAWRQGVRRKNEAQPEVYEDAVFSGRDPAVEREQPAPATALFDAFMMGLRLVHEGVQLERARRVSGADPEHTFGPRLRELCEAGLLESDGERVRAAPDGLAFLDSALERLLPAVSV